jgi:hypothetical protein
MRLLWFASGALLLSSAGILLAQVATQGEYKPPQTLERGLIEDPAFSQAMMNAYASETGIANLRAFVEKQAADGNLLGELLLGALYIPPECTFLPYKNYPTDCPNDHLKSSWGPIPSFQEAVHWLKVASGQGSGEASEILAEVMERAIRSSASTEYQMSDVAHYHALARSQGYDLQDVEYSCYTLDDPTPADGLVMAGAPPEFQFSPQELAAVHAAGASGTLRFRGASAGSGSTLLRHPEGPKVRIRVILSHPVSREVTVPLPNRTDVTYLQLKDEIVTVPPSYPGIARVVVFKRSNSEETGEAAFQALDGTFQHGCTVPVER